MPYQKKTIVLGIQLSGHKMFLQLRQHLHIAQLSLSEIWNFWSKYFKIYVFENFIHSKNIYQKLWQKLRNNLV